jgi:hypothetical protein
MANAAVMDVLSSIREDLAVVKDQLATTQAAYKATLQLVAAGPNCTAAPDEVAINDTLEHRHQRVRVAQQHRSVHDDEILDQIFSFVGLGEYIYAAAVCRNWRVRYMKLCYNRAAKRCTDKLRTSYKSTITTAARLQLALDSGLKVAALQDERVWSKLSRQIVDKSLEPASVFTIAKLHDFRWSIELCTDAAAANKLELLQWLHKSGCPWDLYNVREAAIERATFSDQPSKGLAMLKWLYSVTDSVEPWHQDTLNEQLWEAGVNDNLELAKWFRDTVQHGHQAFIQQLKCMKQVSGICLSSNGHWQMVAHGAVGSATRCY